MSLIFHLFILSCLTPFCLSLTIPSTGPGAYDDLLIAINEKFLPGTVEAESAFLDKLQGLVAEASSSLFSASNGLFYFRSVKILIPSTWQYTNASRAVDESFATADVRVFKFPVTDGEYIAPFTKRSKLCGAQGEYIFLSPTYISKWNEQKNPGKAFVHEWAIYRWGVFEEYGRQKDGSLGSRFPYMLVPSANKTEWKVTGCSDAKIEGSYGYYETDFDTLDLIRHNDCQEIEAEVCRFFPNGTNQVAKTSLMYLTEIDSVSSFCDGTTHDKSSPNRQNYFCNERSAWDVIQRHPDYQGRANTTTFPGKPTFSIVKPSFGVPAVYILVDTSSGNAGIDVFSTLKSKLSEWISSTPRPPIVGLGEYGGNATLQNGLPFRYIVNKYSPAPTTDVVTGELSKLINGMEQNRTSGILIDKAISDASVLLTPQFWKQGSILMLIKLTSNSGTQASMPEGPVIDFLTSRKARLYSLEFSVSSASESSLDRIATASLGKAYFGETNLNTFSSALDSMLQDVKMIATNGFADVNKIVEAGYQTFTILPGKEYDSYFQMYINPSPSVDFQFHVTSGALVDITLSARNQTFSVEKQDGTSWNLGKWDLYSKTFTDTKITARTSWCYRVRNNGAEPITVHATAHHNRNKNPPTLGDPTDNAADIHEFELWVSESTSGEVSVSNTPYQPFGIYAHFFNGLSIVRGLEVSATVTDPNGGTTTIRLYDDAPAGPGNYDIDIEDSDGVYSNIFHPKMPGVHHISIEGASPRAKNCQSANSTRYFVDDIEENLVEPSAVSPRGLLPNQYDLNPPFGNIGGGAAYFQRYFPYFKSVNVKYTSYTALPPRILVLSAGLPVNSSRVTISFYEPVVYDGGVAPEGYTVRYSTNRANLIRAADGALSLVSGSTEVTSNDLMSGSLMALASGRNRTLSFRLTNSTEGAETIYIVMASKLNGPPVRYSPPSPVVFVKQSVVQTTTSAPATTATTVATTAAINATTITTMTSTPTIPTIVTNTTTPVTTTTATPTAPTSTRTPTQSGTTPSSSSSVFTSRVLLLSPFLIMLSLLLR